MHGAGTALRNPAAILGAREVGDIAQRPQQGHVFGNFEPVDFSIDVQIDHGDSCGGASEVRR